VKLAGLRSAGMKRVCAPVEVFYSRLERDYNNLPIWSNRTIRCTPVASSEVEPANDNGGVRVPALRFWLTKQDKIAGGELQIASAIET